MKYIYIENKNFYGQVVSNDSTTGRVAIDLPWGRADGFISMNLLNALNMKCRHSMKVIQLLLLKKSLMV